MKKTLFIIILIIGFFWGFPYLSKTIFNFQSSGFVMAKISPFRIPKNADVDQYCRKFIFKSNKNTLTLGHDGNSYCGYIYGITLNESLEIPFKKHSTYIEFWINPFGTVRCKINSKFNPKNMCE